MKALNQEIAELNEEVAEMRKNLDQKASVREDFDKQIDKVKSFFLLVSLGLRDETSHFQIATIHMLKKSAIHFGLLKYKTSFYKATLIGK